MKLPVKALTIAAAIVNALWFLFIALMNVLLPPYGGKFLVIMTALYIGYDPMTGPISIIIGTLYALLGGAITGALLAWLYNALQPRQT
jgi:membrane associated rhomboid family serine protease